MRVAGGLGTVQEGGEWGKTDAVEVVVQPIVAGRAGPVFVLHGFPSGKLESVTKNAATDAQVAGLANAAAFEARTHEGGWSAEFKLPFAVLGGDLGSLEGIRFNLGARVGVGDEGEWFAWVRTGGRTDDVHRAGELVLLPSCRTSGGNLLHNGTFEQEDLAAWHKTNNAGQDYQQQIAERVREGADGGWCVRIECEDAELMETAVLKWLHPLDEPLAPGTYVLSYDLRVVGLKPQHKSGMFCSYLRTATGPETGRNEGQMQYAFTGSDLPWTRRDCIIEIPDGARPVFVSLQLHKATGTIWLDNVSLLRCE